MVTLANSASRARQLGSGTSNVVKASICWTNVSMRALRSATRSRHCSNSGWLGTERRHGLVFCSIYIDASDCSACLRCKKESEKKLVA